MSIIKREATALVNALGAGVVPRVGLRHIAVGRFKEVEALVRDLDHISEGGATVRFVVGRFGSGKSFLLQLARAHALERKFVVADADFTPDRRLQGSGGQALATYRELMKNLSTQTQPGGNALKTILERWISNLQSEVTLEKSLLPDSPELADAVQRRILEVVDTIEELVHGFDFGTVIAAYYRGYVTEDDALTDAALRWLRGEFNSKIEARNALGVRTIIDDTNFYDYLKAMARFVEQVGYAGLLVCLDEGVNLYKISNSVARNSNYEKLLSIVNDCLQGHASQIGFIFSGTNEFVEDTRRGLFSYEALRSRLAPSRFATSGLQDYSGPVLSLPSLTTEEQFVALRKVRDVYTAYNPTVPLVTDDDLEAYLDMFHHRSVSSEFATPRDLLRDLVSLLNLRAQNPDRSWQQLLHSDGAGTSDRPPGTQVSTPDPLDRFVEFRLN